MNESEIEKLRLENEKLKAELDHLKKIQNDLWSHDIYLKARRKMTVSVITVLSLLSALGLLTVYDLYKKLSDYSTKQAQAKIDKNIEEKIPEIIEQIQPKIDNRIEEIIGKIVEDSRKKVNQQIEEVAKATEEAKGAAERLKHFVLAERGAEPSIVEVERIPIADAACDPENLSNDEVSLISVKQTSKKLEEEKNNGGRIYYQNFFSIAIRSADGASIPKTLKSCILDGIDRVVYKLDNRWFQPNEIVRIDRASDFGFGINIWGVTALSVRIFLKGNQEPIVFEGSFVLGKDSYLKKVTPS